MSVSSKKIDARMGNMGVGDRKKIMEFQESQCRPKKKKG